MNLNQKNTQKIHLKFEIRLRELIKQHQGRPSARPPVRLPARPPAPTVGDRRRPPATGADRRRPPGRPGHVRFPTAGPILHASGPKLTC